MKTTTPEPTAAQYDSEHNIIPITQDFGSSDLEKTVGFAEIRSDKLKEINKILESGKLVEFVVGFISNFPEDGVYKDAKLVEISIVVRDREEESRKVVEAKS